MTRWRSRIRVLMGAALTVALTCVGAAGATRPSEGRYDGWVLESTRASGRGGTLNALSPTLRVGDDARGRQYRAFLSFSTGSLPKGTVVTSATLRLLSRGVEGRTPFATHGNLLVDARFGTFSNRAALEAGDFQAAATKPAVAVVRSAAASGWYSASIPPSAVNLAGPTQLRLRFAKGNDGDNRADYVSFASGNAAAAYRPVLVVTTATPAPFTLTSEAGIDGGALPSDCSCDGIGASPALNWSGAPAGTEEFALLMKTVAVDGVTKWNWVLYDIPGATTGLARNTAGVCVAGATTRGITAYDPPCSEGPGPRLYTFTLYALSGPPTLPAQPSEVTGDVLLQAIAPLTLGSASLDLAYSRSGGPSGSADFTIAQTISDGAQRTTLAFSALAMMTGNLEAQSFFPPGKVADYTGFQYLRDNDPDRMGHNTSFLTRIANNVIFILADAQFAQLKDLAVAQMDDINLYGFRRFTLMKAFRMLLGGEVPATSAGLNENAVRQASRDLYLIDGQISFDRALLYAGILRSMDGAQIAYLDAMKGKGWNSWPDVTADQIRARMSGLPPGTAVAAMTYAGDLFSWYAGSVEADVYFCPERQGTYYGGFYIKDAPAIGHEGYSIDEQLTATAGAALCDSSKGYVTPDQAAAISSLVDTQRDNLYASPAANIVQVRTQIATLLRGLLTSTAGSDTVRDQVLALSGTYGDLDGENNYHYATVFAQVHATLSDAQEVALGELRRSILSGSYADGTPFDFTVCPTPFLYSAVINDPTTLTPYLNDAVNLFFEP